MVGPWTEIVLPSAIPVAAPRLHERCQFRIFKFEPFFVIMPGTEEQTCGGP